MSPFVLASNVANLSSLLEYTDHFDQFKAYRLRLFSSIQEKLGWDPKPSDNPLVAMLRPMILSIMGKSNAQEIVEEARKIGRAHV